MNFTKRELTYVNTVIIKYLLNGCGWFFYAITFLLKEYLIFHILSIVFISITVITTAIILIYKQEPEDEMAYYNLNRAKAITYDLTYITLLCIGTCILVSYNAGTLNLIQTYSIVAGSAGVLEIIMSCIFIYLEKVGD